MTELIFKQAIEKALNKHYHSYFEFFQDYAFARSSIHLGVKFDWQVVNNKLQTKMNKGNDLMEEIKTYSVNDIIFNPDFAKALDYKLKDLGEWCDDRKNPIKFIDNIIN